MLKYLGVLIAVNDIAESRRFYEECLGMKVEADFGVNIGFEGGLAIHLKGHFQDLLGGEGYAPAIRSHAGELYFESEDVDAVEQRLKDAGVEFLHPIREQPWGQRVMRIYDPNGHVIEIAEQMDATIHRLSRQGLSIEQICQKTGMLKPHIEQVLAAV